MYVVCICMYVCEYVSFFIFNELFKKHREQAHGAEIAVIKLWPLTVYGVSSANPLLHTY